MAAAVLRRGGRILITRRPPDKHLGGYWEFPGGKREAAESWEECLAREILEELGIVVRVGDLLHEARHAYPDRVLRLRFYACGLEAGNPRPLGVQDLRWVAPRDLGRYPFPPADTEFLGLLPDLLAERC